MRNKMGFYLKKIIATLLEPLSIVFVLFLVSLFLLYKRKRKHAFIVMVLGLFLLFLFSYRPFSVMLMTPLEHRYEKCLTPPKDVHDIVFIGGDFENRAWELLRLHTLLPDAKIFVSGYEGVFVESEATRNKRILEHIGIDKDKIIAYSKPKDTIEEAKTIKKVLKGKPFILITSAYHMPRAMMIFKHEGFNPIAAPTDFMRKTKRFWLTWPSGKNLRNTEKALHEYIGLAWLYIKGY